MDLKYRKLIARIKPLHEICRVLMYNSGIVYYKLHCRQHQERLKQIKNSHDGERCFIIGNGPSLAVEDLNRLTNEDCFGVNEIHRIFSQTNWRPKYYLIMDRYSKSTPEQIRDIQSETVFLGDYYCRFNEVLRQDYLCVHQHYCYGGKYDRVSSDISREVINSPTVSTAAMQIAAYLGYKEINLLGFDHNYAFEFADDGSVVRTDQKGAHFFEDDVPEDIIANVWGMTQAYKGFKRYADEHHIVVRNATRGGKLEVFERVNFDDVVGAARSTSVK